MTEKIDPYNPKINVSYSIENLETQVSSLLTDLSNLTKNKNTQERQDIIDQSKNKLQKTYKFVYNKSPKLFNLAIEYHVNNKNINEFKDIFKNYIDHIKHLSNNPNKNYIKTSETISRYIGNKFGLPESN